MQPSEKNRPQFVEVCAWNGADLIAIANPLENVTEYLTVLKTFSEPQLIVLGPTLTRKDTLGKLHISLCDMELVHGTMADDQYSLHIVPSNGGNAYANMFTPYTIHLDKDQTRKILHINLERKQKADTMKKTDAGSEPSNPDPGQAQPAMSPPPAVIARRPADVPPPSQAKAHEAKKTKAAPHTGSAQPAKQKTQRKPSAPSKENPMSEFKIIETHSLPQEEALLRVKAILPANASKIADLKEEWVGQTGTFSGKVQGIKISGTITVTETFVQVVGDTTWLAKRKAEPFIREELKKVLKAPATVKPAVTPAPEAKPAPKGASSARGAKVTAASKKEESTAKEKEDPVLAGIEALKNGIVNTNNTLLSVKDDIIGGLKEVTSKTTPEKRTEVIHNAKKIDKSSWGIAIAACLLGVLGLTAALVIALLGFLAYKTPATTPPPVQPAFYSPPPPPPPATTDRTTERAIERQPEPTWKKKVETEKDAPTQQQTEKKVAHEKEEPTPVLCALPDIQEEYEVQRVPPAIQAPRVVFVNDQPYYDSYSGSCGFVPSSRVVVGLSTSVRVGNGSHRESYRPSRAPAYRYDDRYRGYSVAQPKPARIHVSRRR
ncbi:MAG: hypothetical protein JWO00_624 [Candidatus Parcubacteria bacterium]|nr:hypothetical protein [Candidatus Parcubacteria bacterium]